LLVHRRELKVVAQAGLFALVLSLEPRTYAAIDWDAIPGARRGILRSLVRAGQAACLILAVIFTWNHWHQTQITPLIVQTGFSVLLFAWAVLVFVYGRSDGKENIG